MSDAFVGWAPRAHRLANLMRHLCHRDGGHGVPTLRLFASARTEV
jgi:hypothetical protein